MRFQLEHVDCDLCGGNKYRVRYRKPDDWLWSSPYEFAVVECQDCGLVYLNPRPSTESMADFYPSGYHERRTGGEWEQRYELELSYVPKLDGGRLLDIGCARGEFLARVGARWPSVELWGVDRYTDGLHVQNVNFLARDLIDCDFSSKFFDVITAWAVFEHLHQPSAYFAEVARILKPGGTFVFLVTNSESLYGRRAYLEDIPRHTFHYSERTLQMYARASGLTLESIEFDDRIWDGRGRGTFRHLLENVAGTTWDQRRLGRLHAVQHWAGRLGRLLDRLAFHWHWEAALRRSGILVARCGKPEQPR